MRETDQADHPAALLGDPDHDRLVGQEVGDDVASERRVGVRLQLLAGHLRVLEVGAQEQPVGERADLVDVVDRGSPDGDVVHPYSLPPNSRRNRWRSGTSRPGESMMTGRGAAGTRSPYGVTRRPPRRSV